MKIEDREHIGCQEFPNISLFTTRLKREIKKPNSPRSTFSTFSERNNSIYGLLALCF